MKIIRVYLKRISVFLIFLITLQSCSVYHSKSASVDEALRSNNKVKVITESNDVYKLHRLQKENGEIYGLVRKGSVTGERLSDQGLIKYSDSKYETVLIPESTIEEIHLKNKTLSTVLTVAIPVVGVGVLLVIMASTADYSAGLSGI